METKETIFNERVDLHQNWDNSYLLKVNNNENGVYKSITVLKKGKCKARLSTGAFETDLWNAFRKCSSNTLEVYFHNSFEGTNYQDVLKKFFVWVKIHQAHRTRIKRVKRMKKKHDVIIKRKRITVLTARSDLGDTKILTK